MATLVAKTRIKFGSKGRPGPLGQVLGYEAGTTVMPGEEFEADAETAKQLLADGSAVKRSDARAEERDAMSAEERLHEAAEEARAAGLNVSITIEAPGTPDLAAHRENQEEEEAAVAEAKANEPKPAARKKGGR